MKKTLVLITLVSLAACRRETAVPAAQQAETQTTATADAPATPAGMSDYKAQWLDGSPFTLAGEKGKVVLLNVWATWCGPCRFEIPELGKLHTKYASRGFQVIGVSIDEGSAADVKQFVTDQKIAYPIALDQEGKIATLLQTSVIPTTVLVDKAGKVVWKHFGVVSTTDAALTQALESALAR